MAKAYICVNEKQKGANKKKDSCMAKINAESMGVAHLMRLSKVRHKTKSREQPTRPEDSGFAKQNMGSIHTSTKRVARGEVGAAKAVALLP